MQQQGVSEDFVIAIGRQESVRRFIELTALELGWSAIEWQGEGLQEVGRRSSGAAMLVPVVWGLRWSYVSGFAQP